LKLWGSIKWDVWKVWNDKIEKYIELMNNNDLKWSLELAFEYASEINKYVDENYAHSIFWQQNEWIIISHRCSLW
jgi:hypothetical protein